STTSATFTIQDTTAPQVPEAPADVTVACSGNIPPMISLTANDVCGGAITAQGHDEITEGNCSGNFTVTRTWTFIDACQNPSSVSQIITVSDTSEPVFETPPADVTVSCIDEVPPMISLQVSDTCSGGFSVEGVDSVVQGNCPNSFVITRTWSFTDPCGNGNSVSQTITVNDNVAPIPDEAPADITVSCESEIPPMISLSAEDECAGILTVQGVDTRTEGNCPNSFTITRTWSFADPCGNPASVSQIITVNDTVAPVPDPAPAAVTVACEGEIPPITSLSATDNCSGSITVQGVDTRTEGSCPNSFVVTRTWNFVDACGNPATATQIITVNDDIPPTISEVPADITISCDQEIPTAPELPVLDNCSAGAITSVNDEIVQGECPNSYKIIRTWTATDACNNQATASQNIFVIDQTPPEAPAQLPDITVQCSGDIPPMISLTAEDSCAGSITVEGVDTRSEGECPNSYTITRIWTFVDLCNNSSSTKQIITVHDTLPPVPDPAPEDITVTCGSLIPRPVNLTAHDNCSGDIVASAVDSITPGSCANSYVVTRTWTFIDECNNQAIATQIITVLDNIPPDMPEVPADITIACGSEIPVAGSLVATDNCSSPIRAGAVDVISEGECANSYIVTRTWTFIDDCGNQTVATQIITVHDTIKPELPEVPESLSFSCAGEVPQNVVLVTNDNCSGQISATSVDEVTPGDCENSFTILRSWTFTDQCGNSSVAYQTIVVNDETPPVYISGLPNSQSTCDELGEQQPLVFEDNCNGEITQVMNPPVNETIDEDHYLTTWSWTASDACGNSTTVTHSITVSVNDYVQADPKEICNEAGIDLVPWLVQAGAELGGYWDAENFDDSLINGNILNASSLVAGNAYTINYILTPDVTRCPKTYKFLFNIDCGVLGCESINVYNAVSPNHDSLNDVFYISGIDATCYTENNVKIYNRWGILVFDKDGYNNTTVVFDGKSDGRSTVNSGEELPDGTYFYILKYKDPDGNWFDKSGYLYLNR
ncbi:gliding motility-associated C-terminal domain-containing protein, partial [Flavobacterium sp. SM15]|uniref:gliding motility-associated C-terminal domain-containing protein n=1 Tax=Flavobacterium sp. SM15 TaxID=2908005 RepID=UPI001EDA229B